MKLFKNHIKNSKKWIGNGLKFRVLLSTPRFILHFSTFESNQRIIPFDQPSAILQEKNIQKSEKHPLISKLESYINANLHSEQFGVEQLAEMMGMSRSHLHRKLHKVKGKSISRFIREFRLEKARQMLVEKEMTASEVSHAVGFGSPSYFNKCFTEYFGYSPGKARLKVGQEGAAKSESGLSKNKILLWLAGLAATVLVGFLIFSQNKEEAVVAESAPKEKSIIVLPFKNLSSDEENQYLADGMVDAISRHLSGIESLDVISSSASGPLTSAKEISEKLNVSNILQGSIQRQSGTIRVEIKLIETSSSKQLWAKNYDRKAEGILKLQSEIASNVAEVLKTNISQKVRSIMDRRSSYDPIAYDHFMKGFYYRAIYTPEAQKLAVENLTKAIELDSMIAPAYLGLASCYYTSASPIIAQLSGRKALSLAKPLVEKSLLVDPDLFETRGWIAYHKLYQDWDFEAADIGFDMVVRLGTPDTYNVFIDFLNNENRHEEALKFCKELERKLPYYPYNKFMMTYYYLNRWEEGKAQVERKLNLQPNDIFVLDNAGFFLLNTGEYSNALSLFEKAMDLAGKRFPRMLGWMGAAHIHKGEPQKAKELLNELKELKSKTDAGSPAFFIAIIHSALGEKEEALKWLKIAIEDHEMEVPWLVSEPQLYPLHGMPEFDALVKRVGFRDHAYPVKLPKSHPSPEASGPPKEGS